jgi:hypothetical protein
MTGRSRSCLRGLDREVFVARLAHYLSWQHLDAARNIEASVAIMRGDSEPMRKMLDTLVSDGT